MRRSPIPYVLALLLVSACAPAAQTLAPASPQPMPGVERGRIHLVLDSIFDDPAFASAHWGVMVRSLDYGPVYMRNAGRMFVPASNMKIVTTAAALEALGEDYRYRTAVVAAGPVRNGTLHGDLVVVGSGDPTISARMAGDPRRVMRAWADSLRAHGVTTIAGSIVGDDRVFDDRALGRGWAWDDVGAAYSAEISGLPMDEGAIEVHAAPGAAPGDPVRITLLPATAFVAVVSEALTGAAGDARTLQLRRGSDGRTLHVSGRLPLGAEPHTQRVALTDNTRYFVTVLRETLAASGIALVDGPAGPEAAAPRAGGDTLFVHVSPPLREIVVHFMKPSQNQIGEVLLKTLGAELRGTGTAAAGVAVVDSLFASWGLPAALLSQADGSGLSRYNLAAPELFVTLLDRERRSPTFDTFLASFPVAGVDGTLAGRMRGTPLEGNVRGKTGTLSGVRALSGYMETATGERLVFSMLVNHHTLTARDADRIAEAALLRLHAMPRTVIMAGAPAGP